KQSESRYRLLEETITDVVVRLRVSKELPLIYASPSVTRVFGYEPLELIDKNVEAFIHPEDLDLCRKQIYYAIEFPGEYVTCQFRLKHKHEDWIWVESTGVVLKNRLTGELELQTVNRDISDRKAFEQALKENEERYRKISEILSDFVWEIEVSADGNFESNWIVGPIEKIAGVSSITSRIDEVGNKAHPDDVDMLKADFLKTLDNQPTQTEYRIKTADGYRWIRADRLPLFDEKENRVTKIIGSVKSIQTEKETELALVESEARHRIIIDNITDMVTRHALDDLLTSTYVSGSAKGMIGYEPDELVGRSITRYIHKDDFVRNRRLIDYAVENPGETITIIFRCRHKEGYYLWLESTGQVLLNPLSGEYEYFAVSRDITKRKQVEEILRREQQSFQALYQTALGIMNRFDLQDLLINLLNRISKLLNASRAELYFTNDKENKLISQAFIHNGKTGVRTYYQFRGEGVSGLVWDTGKPQIINNYQDWSHGLPHVKTAMNPSDRKAVMAVPLSVGAKIVGILEVVTYRVGTVFFDEDLEMLNRFGNLAALAIDNARLYKAVLDAQEVAELANRAKSTYLTNMSHELRTPMNAILGFTQIMLRDKSLSGKNHERLNMITRSGEYLLALINDVLEISKIEAGQIDINTSDFDLYNLLSDVMTLLGVRAAAKKLRLKLKILEGVPQFVAADEGKLRQVLINLLGNAIKFTERGIVKLKVVYAEKTQKLVFTVSDTGIGIPIEEIQKIFEPFNQTDFKHKPIEGSGLGLPISLQYVRLMGGDIQVLSEVGSGSSFIFDMNIAKSNPLSQYSERLRSTSITKVSEASARILIAEDHLENRELIRAILDPFNFEIKEAVDGIEALEIFEAWEPDLIFMDIRMPKMSGFEATQKIRIKTVDTKSP
ncbi:MAG: PAS domain-containing protein, partial [Chloroflexota bacterium]